jgi:hypothetical protein
LALPGAGRSRKSVALLLQFALGDTLGAAVEFEPAGTFREVTWLGRRPAAVGIARLAFVARLAPTMAILLLVGLHTSK